MATGGLAGRTSLHRFGRRLATLPLLVTTKSSERGGGGIMGSVGCEVELKVEALTSSILEGFPTVMPSVLDCTWFYKERK